MEPKCDECLPPLFPENSEALFIYTIVKNQFIMGFGGPVGINQLAVWEAIEHYQIENKTDCFERVLKACNRELELIQAKLERERPKGDKRKR